MSSNRGVGQEFLVVPGYQGSGPGHWQSWLERQRPEARRVAGIDWDRPVLDQWVEAILHDLAGSEDPVWVIAHSFGCLAGVVAAKERPSKFAGLFLVAPPDPSRLLPPVKIRIFLPNDQGAVSGPSGVAHVFDDQNGKSASSM